MKQFRSELEEERDFHSIYLLLLAKELLKYELDTDRNGQAISATTHVNQYGVVTLTFQIALKKK